MAQRNKHSTCIRQGKELANFEAELHRIVNDPKLRIKAETVRKMLAKAFTPKGNEAVPEAISVSLICPVSLL